METRPDGSLGIAIGASRSGKSVLVKRVVENAERALVFCPKGEYASQFGFERITNKEALIKRVREVGKGKARVNFIANSKADFDFFCAVAFVFNMAAQATIVVEEVGQYTNAGKAIGAWGRLITQSLAYGPTILATVQRGQEVDKTILGNATFVHVLRHANQRDREDIASRLDVPVEAVPDEKLKFFQWSSAKGVVCSGSIDFPKNKATKTWPEGTPRFRENDNGRAYMTLEPTAKFKGYEY
ncbi:MAG: hypothetical protein ACPGMR_11510 [Pontibacterium sp.]